MKTRFTSIFPKAATMLLVMLLTSISAWAEGVDYIDADGTLKNTATDGIDGNDSPIVLTGGNLGSLAAGWYVVKQNGVSYSSGVEITGDVHIIIADGYTMTINVSDLGKDAITINNGSLTIYGQTQGTGSFNVTATGSNASAIFCKNLTINGSNVTATGTVCGFEVNNFTINGGNVEVTGTPGIYAQETVTINGGNVTVTSTNGSGIEAQETVTINGGNVNATGAVHGIYGYEGITLSYTKGVSLITASNFGVEDGYAITVANGQAFTDGTNRYDANTSTTELAALTDITLLPDVWGVTSGADGSDTKPYTISNTTGLDLLAIRVNSGIGYEDKHFVMTDDIQYDYSSLAETQSNFTAIGEFALNKFIFFKGHFDGQGHTVSGIRIRKDKTVNSDSNKYQGLFGFVKDGSIRNVVVSDASIKGYQYVSGIVGSINYATLENCLVVGSTIECNSNSGVIVGSYEKQHVTFSHNYYSGCTLKEGDNEPVSSNIGDRLGDITNNDGAVQATLRTLTLNDDITARGIMVNQSGTLRVVEGTTVTLSYTGSVPAGCDVRFSIDGGTTLLVGKTFTMPADDVTVTTVFPAKPTNTEAITYVDADDRRKTKDAGTVYILDGLEGTLGQSDADTWYLANSNVTYTSGLTLKGNVHLILADGKTMTVTNTSGTAISGTGNFAIYARDFESYNYGSLVVTGSTHGICCSGNVTINGGKVEAVSTGSTADGCYGIKANGDITLGWTSLNDNITASSYSGNTVRIADGWTLTYSTKIGKDDVTNCCSGTLSTAELAAIAGKTLTPLTVVNCSGSVAWDDNDNRYDIRPDAVTLHLYKNGDNDDITTTSATASDGWRFSIGEGNYPSFVTNGDIKTPVVYTVGEEEVDGYTADISSSYYGFTITNTLVTSGTCGKTANDNVTWEVTDTDGDDTYDKLTISGTGAMANYNNNKQPWKDFKSVITTVVIEDGVTIIGYDAFNGCTLLSTVTFTGTPQLTAIYDAAFYGCTALTAIDIPASVTTLERAAFQYCTNLATVSGGDGLTSIGANVFYGTAWKNNLANNLSDGLFYLGHVAFLMKGNATDITLAEGTTQIYDDAFYQCTTLTTIIIPASVESIGEAAFSSCENLSKVYVLRTTPMTTLGGNAFSGCDPNLVIVVPADADYRNHSLNGYWQNYNLQSGYTVTCDTGITFTTTNNGPLVEQGETVTLSGTGTTPAGYTTPFVGYNVIDSWGDPVNMLTENTFTMPGNVTVNATWTTIPWTGSGDTADDPYIIEYPSQLDLLATNVNAGNEYSGKYFELANDITYAHTTAWNDANSKENNYTAIGCIKNSNILPFEGIFDGKGHTVSGIRIYKWGTTDAESYQGLFGILGSNGTVKNVTVADACITAYEKVGGVVGEIIFGGGKVENCHAAATVALHAVMTKTCDFGGIAGCAGNTTVSGCSSAVTLTKKNNCYHFGGIVGSQNGGVISNNLVVGVTIPDLHYTDQYNNYDASGAIVGYNSGATLEHNYYSGCTVGTAASGIGVGSDNNSNDRHDITDNDGAVPAVILSETQTSMPVLSENDKVVFRREFKENVSSTVCLPFSIDATQAAVAGEFYTFVGVDKTDPNDWIVVMQETPTSNLVEGALAANTPYLFKPKATGPVLFHGEAAASSTAGTASDTEGWTFQGTYARIDWLTDPQTIYGFAATNATTISPGTFFRVKGGSNSYILPFRAYLDAAGGGSAAPRRGAAENLPSRMTVRLVNADGETTSLTPNSPGLSQGEGSEYWYDLSGRKLDKQPTQKGVYINNGKKVVIK